LTGLGAVDAEGGLTERGKKMRALALPPRLAAMVVPGVSKTGTDMRRRNWQYC
jgi:ATP-dependent helicase HrpB